MTERHIRRTGQGQYYRITTDTGLCYRLHHSLYNVLYQDGTLDSLEDTIRTHHQHSPADFGIPNLDGDDVAAR